MNVSIKRSIKSIFTQTNIGKKLFFYYSWWLYFEKIGYFKSFREKLPIDGNGDCLPWFTYPVISFLNGKLRSDMTVFEYGSGNSTLWWSKQVFSVTSCEHQLNWYNFLKERIASNVNYIYCQLDYGGRYCETSLESKVKFDIIVIDGRDRVNCAKNSLGALKEDGVIIWDNSNREQYREGYSYLIQNGFKRLDFEGLGPNATRAWCTSIFYRDNNCFGI